MENSDSIELEKFAVKAGGYKSALNFSPQARSIEIATIIGVLDGFIKDCGLSKSEVCVVELMAGSGYLTSYLAKCGYRNIHALEASNHMSSDERLKHKYITKHAIDNILSIDGILKEVKPNIIVSIAGFHHMIEYVDNEIDIEKSVDKQKKLVDLCMKYIHKNGILLIEDIYNSNLSNDIAVEPDYWNTRSIPKIIPKKIIEQSIYKKLVKSNNIDEFSVVVRDSLMSPLHKDSNPTAKWFSDVVDKETTVGHKDIPINKMLIDNLSSSYTTKYITLNCPWIFKSIDELKSYVTNFWFVEHKDDVGKLSFIFEEAKRINGVHFIDENNRVSFGWSLALITIQNKEQGKPSKFYTNILMLLMLLIGLSIAGIFLKIYTSNFFIIGVVSNVLVFVTGITAKEFYDKMRQ